MEMFMCKCCGATEWIEKGDTIICEYCKMPYVVEKPANNNPSISNLLARAKSAEDVGDEDTALEYYDRVLDLDVTCLEAIEGHNRIVVAQNNAAIERTFKMGQNFEQTKFYYAAWYAYSELLKSDPENEKIKQAVKRMEYYLQEHIFFESEATCKNDSGKMYLKRFQLLFEGKRTGTHVYDVEKMSNLTSKQNVVMGNLFGKKEQTSIKFSYESEMGKIQVFEYNVNNVIELVQLIFKFNQEKMKIDFID